MITVMLLCMPSLPMVTYPYATNHKLLISRPGVTAKSMQGGSYYRTLVIICDVKLSMFHVFTFILNKRLWLAALPAFTVFTIKTSPKDFIICLGPSIAFAKGFPKINICFVVKIICTSLNFTPFLYSYT